MLKLQCMTGFAACQRLRGVGDFQIGQANAIEVNGAQKRVRTSRLLAIPALYVSHQW